MYLVAYLATFVTAFFVAYLSLDIRLFYIQGVYVKIPIPILYWSCALLYAYFYSKAFKEQLRSSFSKVVKPFLLTQLVVLLVDFNLKLVVTNSPNKILLLYSWFLMLFLFSILAYYASRFIERSLIEKKFVLSFELIYVLSFISLVILLARHKFLLGIFVIFVIFFSSFFIDFGTLVRQGIDIIKRISSNRVRFLVLLYFLALFIRCVSIPFAIGDLGDTPPSGHDGLNFDHNALMIAKNFRNLFNGSLTFYVFGPYYWIFLGIIYKLFGRNFFIVSFIQSIFASLLAPLVYFLTIKLSGEERISKIASILTATAMLLIDVSVNLRTESIFIPLLYLFLLLLLYYPEKKINYVILSFITGIIFGIMNGIRSIMILFPVFLIIWFFLYVKNINIKMKVVYFTILLVTAYIVTLPAEIMYSKDTKYRKLSSTVVISPAAITYGGDNGELNSMGFNPFSNITKSLSVFIKEPKKVSYLFFRTAALNTYRFFFTASVNPFILVLPPPKYSNEFGTYILSYLYIFILLGAIRFFSKNLRKDVMYLLVFLFIYYFMSHPLFFNMKPARYRAPVYPFFIILFSLGFFYVWDWLKKDSDNTGTA